MTHAFLPDLVARRPSSSACFGGKRVTHAFLPDLVARLEAHLVNIALASGLIGLSFGATYASSKWAVIGFSESIRLELGLRHRVAWG